MPDHWVHLFWYHWVCAAVGAVGLVAPVALWKGRRLGYCAGLSALLLAVLATFWILDRGGTGRFVADHLQGYGSKQSGGEERIYKLFIQWSRGSVSVGYEDTVAHISPGHLTEPNWYTVGWYRTDPSDLAAPYVASGFGHPVVGRAWLPGGGFKAQFGAVADDLGARAPHDLRYAELVVPMWFFSLGLLVLPAWWFYRSRWGAHNRRSRWLRRGLCGLRLSAARVAASRAVPRVRSGSAAERSSSPDGFSG